jgi:hypothetical protein
MPDDLLTKEESAEVIGCSVRSFEQYKSQGLITHAEMRKGKRGQQAVYLRADVEALKQALEQKRNESKGGVLAIQKREGDSEQNERMLAVLEAVATALSKPPQLTAAVNADKFLTVKEAAEKFGLSESYIRKAHKEGQLNVYHLPSVRGDRVSEREIAAHIAGLNLEKFIKPRPKAKAAKHRSG